jgi:penicillin-binding protein 1A
MRICPEIRTLPPEHRSRIGAERLSRTAPPAHRARFWQAQLQLQRLELPQSDCVFLCRMQAVVGSRSRSDCRACFSRLAKLMISQWLVCESRFLRPFSMEPSAVDTRSADDSRQPMPGSSSRSRLGFAAATLLGAIAILAGAAAWFFVDMSWPSAADVISRRVLVLVSADGHDLFHKGNLRLAPIDAKDMAPDLINAVLSTEDRRFFGHTGINPLSMLRAFRENFEAGRIVAGGSTITQQLVKNLFLGPERTYKRKVQEAAIAIWLEHHLSKHEILTSYLNNVYLGSGAVGFPAAAKIYFGKDVAHLNVAEAAMLAGMISAPSQDNPFHDLNAARNRAASVLDAMVANGKLTEDVALMAKLHPAVPSQAEISPEASDWFVDWVYSKTLSVIPKLGGTVRLRTTLDLGLQQEAANVVKSTLAKYGTEKHASEAALVAMRPDGAVVAMVGGRSYAGNQYNRAVEAQRQPGSAFKLFDYYAALRQGFTSDSRILDAPIDVHGWQPENYGRRYHGQVTLAEAFANSLNDAAVRLSQQVGIGAVIAAARDLGLRAPLPNNPSLALGTAEVTLLDLTSAYAAVRAGKAPVTPHGISAIKTHNDRDFVSFDSASRSQHNLGPYQPQLINLLRGVVEHGTGRAAALQEFAAGKTGTTQDYRDAWFIGFTDSLVVGVWVGNDDHSPMKGVAGGTLPARIWRDFMEKAGAPNATEVNAATSRAPGVTVGQAQEPFESYEGTAPPFEMPSAQCNIPACEQFYHSFRAWDCTYHPYSGGPRQYCQR